MKQLFLSLAILLSFTLSAQREINGKIIDEKGIAVQGVNVYIDGSYDGTVSDSNGVFSFVTSEVGTKTLLADLLTYEIFKKVGEVSVFKNLVIKLRESVTSLDAVVITAGSFESGDKAKVAVLKPLDIVTTAGTAGNIIGALNTLPGTQTVGEDGRLFVRGGEANETQTFVDGLRVPQPYGPTANNIPTRSRFSPFLFNGVSFSTGGYSAEYGEALSSVLSMNTMAEPVQNQTDISLMTVGLGLGKTSKWENQSVSLNLSYINLAPYQELVPQSLDWNKPINSGGGEVVYRYHFKKGILRAYAAYDQSNLDINSEDINLTEKVRFGLNNDNTYGNISYKGELSKDLLIHTGLSYGIGKNKISIDDDLVNNVDKGLHYKLKLMKSMTDRITVVGGVDYFYASFNEKYKEFAGQEFPLGFNNNIAATYLESDLYLSKNLIFKAGARASHNQLLDEVHINPRASMGYKVSSSSQFSLAYGDFSQAPTTDYIKFNQNLNSESAQHYIMNYQYKKEGRLFRSEVYVKNYQNLVKYNTTIPQYNSSYDNDGDGYARGLDLFWRDGKTFKEMDYWISYSYIDSKRNYQNFPSQATPSFIAKHTASIVTKTWIDKLTSQVGFSYTVNSGRPYNNPNEDKFMNGKTKAYQSLSFNWAYLMSKQKIFYFSISNILGTDNVFGYQYANTPNANGEFNRRAVTQPASRFIFAGFFWTISEDKKNNMLDNL